MSVVAQESYTRQLNPPQNELDPNMIMIIHADGMNFFLLA